MGDLGWFGALTNSYKTVRCQLTLYEVRWLSCRKPLTAVWPSAGRRLLAASSISCLARSIPRGAQEKLPRVSAREGLGSLGLNGGDLSQHPPLHTPPPCQGVDSTSHGLLGQARVFPNRTRERAPIGSGFLVRFVRFTPRTCPREHERRSGTAAPCSGMHSVSMYCTCNSPSKDGKMASHIRSPMLFDGLKISSVRYPYAPGCRLGRGEENR